MLCDSTATTLFNIALIVVSFCFAFVSNELVDCQWASVFAAFSFYRWIYYAGSKQYYWHEFYANLIKSAVNTHNTFTLNLSIDGRELIHFYFTERKWSLFQFFLSSSSSVRSLIFMNESNYSLSAFPVMIQFIFSFYRSSREIYLNVILTIFLSQQANQALYCI